MQYLLKPTLSLLILVIAIIGSSVVPHILPPTIVVFTGILAVSLTGYVLRGSLLSGYLAIFFLGVVWVSGYARQVSQGWLDDELHQTIQVIQAVVVGMPVVSGELTRFDVRPLSDLDVALPAGIRLSWFRAPELRPGDVWQFTVKLKRPHSFASPGVMDYEAWIVRQKIQATGYVKEAKLLESPEPWSQWLSRFRLKLKLWIKNNSGEATQGMLIALLTGDKSGISQAQWQQLNLSGTTHLLVISGLHIGLMSALGFWLVSWIGMIVPLPLRRCPLPVIAGISGLLLALFYAALAGFSIPVQRALIMTSVALAGPVFGVRASVVTLWLLALALVLLLDPLAFTSQGFWYSFLAVAALIFGLGGRCRQRAVNRWLKPQWVVFCMLTPLLLMSGQSVSLFSPLINLLAIPFIGVLVVPLILLAGFLSALWPWLAYWLLVLADQLMVLFQWGLTKIEPYLFPLAVQGEPDKTTLILTLIGVLLLISPASLRLRGFALIVLLPWFFPGHDIPEYGQAEVTVFDIGQGLAVLIQTRNHVLIYDTGDRFTDELTAADRVLLPGLRSAGIKHIDRVMISHGDRDHSGGLSSLVRKFGELDVWAGSDIENYQGDYHQCQAGQHWQWDGVDFRILAGGEFKLSNDRSCVLKISAGNHHVLLPGDISKKVEHHLLAYQDGLQANVLVAPHHGSKYSNSQDFLKAVRPEVVVFSSGFANRFGHPAKETRERVMEAEARAYNTAEHGSVSFTLGGKDLQVSGYRQVHPRYWRQ